MRVQALLLISSKLAADPLALSQLRDACRIPGVEKVVATPDIHPGYGVPIGSIVGTRDVVIPAAVGYGINCGMRVLTTDLVASETDAAAMAGSLRRDVPLGGGKRNVPLAREDFLSVLEYGVPALTAIKGRSHPVWDWLDVSEEPALRERIEAGGSMPGRLDGISERAILRGRDQLGTLGGGNHFVEFQEVVKIEDEQTALQWGIKSGRLLIMIHSGSRGFGHQVGNEYMDLARSRTWGKDAPNRELCFLPVDSREGEAYIGAMHAGANLAFANRHLLGFWRERRFSNTRRTHVWACCMTCLTISLNSKGTREWISGFTGRGPRELSPPREWRGHGSR
ncbi:MAG: RtcB family protein [Acidobacteriota bacterium]|jgi:tRNA-splicing ligase RtcB (3'-phosphate/5'-hydroxy nucleic acid ligase)